MVASNLHLAVWPWELRLYLSNILNNSENKVTFGSTEYVKSTTGLKYTQVQKKYSKERLRHFRHQLGSRISHGHHPQGR